MNKTNNQAEILREAGLEEWQIKVVLNWEKNPKYAKLLCSTLGSALRTTINNLKKAVQEGDKEKIVQEVELLKNIFGPDGYEYSGPKGICSGFQPNY